MPQPEGIRIALVGRGAYGRTSVANWLFRHHKFKMLRLDDGIQKFVRYMYMYQPHKRVKWEHRLKLYDATYKVDPAIHIGYLLRKLKTVPPEQDVVVPDARYINEIQELIRAGFILIRVTDPAGYKPTRMAGMAHAAPGTVKLQEFYQRNVEAYSVDYSISTDTLEKFRKSIDKVVDKERAKRAIIINGDQPVNESEAQ